MTDYFLCAFWSPTRTRIIFKRHDVMSAWPCDPLPSRTPAGVTDCCLCLLTHPSAVHTSGSCSLGAAARNMSNGSHPLWRLSVPPFLRLEQCMLLLVLPSLKAPLKSLDQNQAARIKPPADPALLCSEHHTPPFPLL